MSGCVLTCVDDYEEAARQLLPGATFEYYAKGVKKLEQTLKDSKKAFTRYRLRPRVFQSSPPRNLSTTVLGQHIDIPIGISPTACHGLAHTSKEKGTIKAAQNHGTVTILSSIANTHINDLHEEAARGPIWMQIYFFKTFAVSEAIIRRAERAGFKAFVVTIDSPGLQQNQTSTTLALSCCNYLKVKEGVKIENLDTVVDENREAYNNDLPNLWDYSLYEVNESHATAEDIKWLKSNSELPVILKGVLTASTAKVAASLGVDGILVSTHGGRNLDGVPAPIDVLAEIVEAVKGTDIEVYLDGGVRTGTDILKALALGAKAVFIGRPALWGLAVDGSRGVERVLQILKDELDLAMSLSGISDVRHVSPSLLMHESEYLASKL